jgi:hypothetical protein
VRESPSNPIPEACHHDPEDFVYCMEEKERMAAARTLKCRTIGAMRTQIEWAWHAVYKESLFDKFFAVNDKL